MPKNFCKMTQKWQKPAMKKSEPSVGVQNKLANDSWQSDARRIISFSKADGDTISNKDPGALFIKMSFGLISDYNAKAFQSMTNINKHKNNGDLFNLMSFSNNSKDIFTSNLFFFYGICMAVA